MVGLYMIQLQQLSLHYLYSNSTLIQFQLICLVCIKLGCKYLIVILIAWTHGVL